MLDSPRTWPAASPGSRSTLCAVGVVLVLLALRHGSLSILLLLRVSRMTFIDAAQKRKCARKQNVSAVLRP